jgi:battenin
LSEGYVLLADILPSFIIKSTFPYFVNDHLPHRYRILLCCLLSSLSLLLISSTTDLYLRFIAIFLASSSSGMGEMTFVQMVSLYNSGGGDVLVGWGLGTGLAGLFGSFVYLLMSTVFKWDLATSFGACQFFPLVMLLNYWFVLSHGPLKTGLHQKRRVSENEVIVVDQEEALISVDVVDVDQEEALLVDVDSTNGSDRQTTTIGTNYEKLSLHEKLVVVKSLVWKYMLPLFFVYWSEYAINQGVSPMLLFRKEHRPFFFLSEGSRDHYVVYLCLYQFGVFLSRSSVRVCPLREVWTPTLLQILNFGVLLTVSLLITAYSAALQSFGIWLVFLVIFWEGLLGGAVYVNVFDMINRRSSSSELDLRKREFSMGVCTLADTLGIICASGTAILLGPWICQYQSERLDYNLCLQKGT